MTDQELLLAMSNLFDKKLRPIEERLDRVENKVDRLEANVLPRLQRIEDTLECNVLPRLKKIEMTQENVILPRLQNIEECYLSTYKRYAEGVERQEAIQADVDILKRVVADHSARLQMLAV